MDNWKKRDFANDREAQAEIQRFKTDINLVEFAERQYGFQIRLDKCSKANVAKGYNIVMSNGVDHILVSQKQDTHEWVYADAGDIKAKVGGDIFRMIEWQESKKFGDAIKTLRTYTGAPDYTPQARINLTNDRGPEKDLNKIHKAIAHRKPVETSDYLEQTRQIARETFTHPLFMDRVLKGYNGFIIFPHHNENGLVGYEYRGVGGKGFAKHGYKGLWFSQVPKVVDQVVFTESPIEALCHFEFHHQPKNTLYISAGGTWKAEVSQLIAKVMNKYPEAKIVAAYNNDKGGHDQTRDLEKIALTIGRKVVVTMPSISGQDWNDQLKQSRQQPTIKKKTNARIIQREHSS